jgi:hypothetical protein
MSTSDYEPLQVLPRVDRVVDRRRFLVDQARGRRVLHLGCVDDRLTTERLDAGLLLHDQLGRVATELTGVDISASGIELLREALPGRYEVGDVEDLRSLSLPAGVDVVIASELIEHLSNPGRFLDGLRGLLEATGAVGIVTTPNAYSWVGFSKMAIRRREPTHPDHLILYSPYTLVASLERAGLRVDSLLVHDWDRAKGWRDRVRGLVTKPVLWWSPHLGVGLVACVSAQGATADTT